jgi:hypothetical protein
MQTHFLTLFAAQTYVSSADCGGDMYCAHTIGTLGTTYTGAHAVDATPSSEHGLHGPDLLLSDYHRFEPLEDALGI